LKKAHDLWKRKFLPAVLKNPSGLKGSGILGFSLLPKIPALRQTPWRRSENVVQVVANHTKLRTEDEQNGEKQLAAFSGNLLCACGIECIFLMEATLMQATSFFCD
jgi:hypothetical protein